MYRCRSCSVSGSLTTCVPMLWLLQSRLSQDAVERARRQIIGHFAGHGHLTSLRGMFELAMAASLGDLEPTIFRRQPKNLPNFHFPSSCTFSHPRDSFSIVHIAGR